MGKAWRLLPSSARFAGGLPGFAHAGEVETFVTGVAHYIPQVQKQGFFQVGKSLLLKAVFQGKEGVAGKAEGGVVEADRLKILPGFLFLLVCKQVGQTGHQQQNIRLLDDFVPLEPVKAHMMVACPCIRLQLLYGNRLQQVEGIVLAQPSGGGFPGPFDCLPKGIHLFNLLGGKAQGMIPFRALFPKVRYRMNCQSQIVLHHHIGEKIVVGNAAILVRTFAEE